MSKDAWFHFKVEVALESCVSFVEQKIHTLKTSRDWVPSKQTSEGLKLTASTKENESLYLGNTYFDLDFWNRKLQDMTMNLENDTVG